MLRCVFIHYAYWKPQLWFFHALLNLLRCTNETIQINILILSIHIQWYFREIDITFIVGYIDLTKLVKILLMAKVFIDYTGIQP